MLAYSKIEIYNQLVVSDLVKDEYFEHELFSYFPKIMQKRFCDEIFGHQLKKEIIATQITNFVVNKVGITFVNQICQDTGFSLVDVIKSLIIACDAFRLRQTWEEIENLDGKITPDIQIQMFLSPRKLLERSVMWLVRDKSKGSLKSIVQSLKKINDELFAIISEVLSKDSRESFERKIEKYDFGNLSYGLANKIAAMDPIASAFEISEISAASNFDLKTIAKIYFAVGTRFSLKWLRSKVKKLSLENYWEKVSTKIILEEIYYYQMQIAKRVVAFSCWDKGLCEINSLDKWIKNTGSLVERFDSFIFDLKSKPNPDLAIFIVALNRLKLLLTSDLQ
jgi:glutamate dehydrogenase